MCISFLQNNTLTQILSLTLLGSLMGFLPYNFHPAKIFLGDNGSTIIGFILALLVVSTSSINLTELYFFACLLILSLPILDMSLAIFRRIKNRKNIFAGDRDHYYDKLLKKGFTQKQTVLISFGASSISASIGIGLVIIFS
jgi:UDP-GlcNAc:undecaprenyl-phosphate GlcNAc-1-phosphate transferase